jgi:hypothetical protein
MLGVIHLRQGEPMAAQQAADTAVNLVKRVSPTFFATLRIYSSIAQVYLALLEQVLRDPATPAEAIAHLQLRAEQANHDLNRFAHHHPIGRPYARLYWGLYQWLTNQPQRALRNWHKSLAEAQRLGMRYVEGLAHYEIGRHGPADDQRQEHLHHAGEIFTALDAAYALNQVQQALQA